MVDGGWRFKACVKHQRWVGDFPKLCNEMVGEEGIGWERSKGPVPYLLNRRDFGDVMTFLKGKFGGDTDRDWGREGWGMIADGKVSVGSVNTLVLWDWGVREGWWKGGDGGGELGGREMLKKASISEGR